MAAAPEIEADVLADVSRRTYSAYAAGNERANGAMLWAWTLSLLGSKRAARRVAARRRESGRDDGLQEAAMDVENGSGAGSGQARDWEAKLLDVGIWKVGLSAARVLRWSSLMGSSALVRNSFTDLVW